MILMLLLALQAPNVATERYETRTLQGWTVRVNKDLLAGEHEATGAAALALLDDKLKEAARLVPARPLAELRKVPVWLGVDDYLERRACYHPSADWLKGKGLNPDKAKAVEIGSAATFLKHVVDQPMMVLHELAHAYHDRVLGFDHAALRAAYRAAQESGCYDDVLRSSGRREKAYAMASPQEYFAEASEAWFGQNDFYPFVRAELREHDRALYDLLKSIWAP